MPSPFGDQSKLSQLMADLPDPETCEDPQLASLLRENQALQEQILDQTQLLHLMTHQLSTPLTTLKMSLQMLGEPSLPGAQRQEFLEMVQQQIRHLQNLLRDMLALRNLETGTLTTQIETFSVATLVQEVVASFEPYPTTYCLSPDLPPVRADRWQVSQVLCNLLSNASKYSPDGHPIEVGAQVSHSGEQVEIWVRDYGLGVPEADQPHLFERFYRVKHRDRQNIQGTGLGLSLCKLLVENQGGTLDFESTHGQGSRFFFTLPTAHQHHY